MGPGTPGIRSRPAGVEGNSRTQLSVMLAVGMNRQFHQAQPGTITGI
jgi:hypothetical protein